MNNRMPKSIEQIEKMKCSPFAFDRRGIISMKNGVEKLGKQFIAIILVLAMCLQTGVAATC